MKKFPIINYPFESALNVDAFKEMDYQAIGNYALPVELMMENAGLHLARLVSSFCKISDNIKVGVGNGNNGGGGLVAARRLCAWGYNVELDLFTEITKELPKRQLERAKLFGAKEQSSEDFDVWIDAYLGFSQRLPLSEELKERVEEANNNSCIKISLDLPTGFIGNPLDPYFNADKILTLAAPKKILYNLPKKIEIYLADLGIPIALYRKYLIDSSLFQSNSILKLKR